MPNRIKIIIFLLIFALSGCANLQDYSQRSDVQPFIARMTQQYGFNHAQVVHLLHQAKPQPDVLKHMQKPHEHMPWYAYRKSFLTSQRIQDGVTFWQAHEADLSRAQSSFGVPAEIIVAILGVETHYGHVQGSYRTLDALATLAFDYPPRAAFFQQELGEFFLLTRELNLDPLNVYGSYAGALGAPQFMPSSYRHYAIDFDNDQRSDLFANSADVIGSVAYYFKAHGWQANQPITVAAKIIRPQYVKLGSNLSIEAWEQLGVKLTTQLPADVSAKLLILEGETKPEYWLTLPNFAVIMRYNTSPLYAMAVYQLSQEIAARYHQGQLNHVQNEAAA
jgi:membrane-bound lytic murein transglycosylase B